MILPTIGWPPVPSPRRWPMRPMVDQVRPVTFRTVCAALLSLASGPLDAQAPDRWQPIRDSIQHQLLEVHGAAMTVAVAKDGKIVWEDGFGWANREKMIPATPHTMFSLASISKPVTATGSMVLVRRGKVDLVRPANGHQGVG